MSVRTRRSPVVDRSAAADRGPQPRRLGHRGGGRGRRADRGRRSSPSTAPPRNCSTASRSTSDAGDPTGSPARLRVAVPRAPAAPHPGLRRPRHHAARRRARIAVASADVGADRPRWASSSSPARAATSPSSAAPTCTLRTRERRHPHRHRRRAAPRSPRRPATCASDSATRPAARLRTASGDVAVDARRRRRVDEDRVRRRDRRRGRRRGRSRWRRSPATSRSASSPACGCGWTSPACPAGWTPTSTEDGSAGDGRPELTARPCARCPATSACTGPRRRRDRLTGSAGRRPAAPAAAPRSRGQVAPVERRRRRRVRASRP